MIVFVSNFFNHHQEPLAKELFNLTKGEYRFIELEPMPDSFAKNGYADLSSSPMVIQAWKNEEKRNEAQHLVYSADTVLFGNLPDFKWIEQRLKDNKLTFEVGERWLKRGLVNLFSPHLLKSQLFYHFNAKNRPLYRLNASAFAAKDMRLLFSYKNKMFKWGYFTSIPKINPSELLKRRINNKKIKFIVVARLINWKRIDLVIKAANLLKKENLEFEINIYGSGPEELKLLNQIKKFHLQDVVNLKGNLSNNLLLEKFKNYDACIFPSNQREGWGAVVNEAMSHACPVIGSDKVGAVPFLIENGKNGLIFKSGDYKDLAFKIRMIIQKPELRRKLGMAAYDTMIHIWSPNKAAQNLLTLINSIPDQNSLQQLKGPASLDY